MGVLKEPTHRFEDAAAADLSGLPRPLARLQTEVQYPQI
jgi:hypothetical protein